VQHSRQQSDNSFSAAAKLDDLSDREKQEVENQSRPNAALIHETIRAEGESELERTVTALALSGLAAGLSIGFSLIVQGELTAALPEGFLRTVLSPLGYAVGFLIVVLGRQQLFTENTLTPVLALIHNRNRETLLRLMRLWAIVLTANVTGAILFAAAVHRSGAFDPNVLHAFSVIGHQTIRSGFAATMMRAIYAGWLIALMVWLLPAAEGSRPLIIIILTYVVAFSGFSHIIAGTVDCAYVVLANEATWSEFIARFFVPTLIGNMLGGVALVAALNYGQVAPEVDNSK
jgi:formate/nitrite transporter FocA (FNT family)